MYDILPYLIDWQSRGSKVALATVVRTWGSSPREVGAKMALTDDGAMAGSVSGGCVESAVIEVGMRTLESGIPKLLGFQVSDEEAFNVGLTCGGQISVFVQNLIPDWFTVVEQELASRHPISLITIIRGPEDLCGHRWAYSSTKRLFGSAESKYMELELEVERMAQASFGGERAKIHNFQLGKRELQLFVEMIPPPPVLLMVGGVHISQILASLAKLLGYETIVIDPRKTFSDPNRFPQVDRLVRTWPQESLDEINLNGNTAVAVLTHDPKIDDPALVRVLSSEVFYVGALGSRKTQEERRKRLLAAGVDQDKIDLIHAPIGLNLGGGTPEEIALAIMAEIVQARYKNKNK